MEKNLKITYDKFVDAVRPDPKDASKLVLMSGFIGKSNEDNHIRLYTDVSLNDFVEIPEAGIVYCEALSKEASPMGGSKLWVKQDSVVTLGDPATNDRVKKQLLDGDLIDFFNQSKPDFGALKPIPCGWNGNPTLDFCNKFITKNPTCATTVTVDYGCRLTRTCRFIQTNVTPCVRFRTGCGYNYSTIVAGPIEGIFQAGTVGMPTPTEPVPTPATPRTPVLQTVGVATRDTVGKFTPTEPIPTGATPITPVAQTGNLGRFNTVGLVTPTEPIHTTMTPMTPVIQPVGGRWGNIVGRLTPTEQIPSRITPITPVINEPQKFLTNDVLQNLSAAYRPAGM